MSDNLGVFFIAISFFIGGLIIGWKLGESWGKMEGDEK